MKACSHAYSLTRVPLVGRSHYCVSGLFSVFLMISVAEINEGAGHLVTLFLTFVW